MTEHFFVVLADESASNHPCLLFIDTAGNLESNLNLVLQSEASFSAKSIQKTGDGFIITGDHWSLESDYQLVLLRLGSYGERIWKKEYDIQWADQGFNAIQTSDGGFIAVGRTQVTESDNDTKLLVIKTDSSGNSLWNRTYGNFSTSKSYRAFASAVQQTLDDGFIIAGCKFEGYVGEYTWLLKLNASGVLQWSKVYGTVSARSLSVFEAPNGLITSVGRTDLDDLHIFQTNALGTLTQEWLVHYPDVFLDIASADIQPDGQCIAVARENSRDPKPILLAKSSAESTLQVEEISNDLGPLEVLTVRIVEEGEYLVLAESGQNLVLIRLSESISGELCGNMPLPENIFLSQNHPNPFNPTTTIRYELSAGTKVQLVVYDLQGREVARLAEGYRQPGTYEATWDGRGGGGRQLPSGIYIARLTTLQYTKAIKMVLLK
ncbi:FlgD immunoglobulin-like domain containing protein [Candidatus Neomarinimicrobiota bacterium]